jgi:hypothetical protein
VQPNQQPGVKIPKKDDEHPAGTKIRQELETLRVPERTTNSKRRAIFHRSAPVATREQLAVFVSLGASLGE